MTENQTTGNRVTIYQAVTAMDRTVTVSQATDGSNIKVTISGDCWTQEARQR